MKKRLLGVRLFALAAIVACVVAVPSALADEPQGQAESYSSGLWFVELNGKPAADGGSVASNKAEKAAFRSEAAKAKVSFTERFAFDTLWNGLSIKTGVDAATLNDIKGVKEVYPVLTASIPPMAAADPDLAFALAMTGADLAQSSLGFDGTGIKVAVMDTGLDLDHADLGGDGVAGEPFTNTRVVAQHDFVGDSYNANPADPAFQPNPNPDAFADDCNGHGTHVSGIVGADGAVTGVAPGVEFGAYRVFGCSGSTDTDIMIAAMELALADDMDVLNMSIGSAFNTWPQYPTAQASDNAVKQGMAVVASIGNSGTDGVHSAGAPGVGNDVIGTASYDNSHVVLNNFTVTPAGLTVGFTQASGSPAAPTVGSLPLVKANAVGTVPPGVLPTNDGCTPVLPGAYAGMAVLIRRGTCTFHAKSLIAQNGGASAVVLYNNVPGYFASTVAGSPAITIPVVTTSDGPGIAMHNAIVSGPQVLNWQSGSATFVNPTGGTISSFSSFGPGAELALKPDIGAPGGLIRSTLPLEAGAYGLNSGTSMASPHVAGAAALYLEAHPGTSPGDLRDALQNSADPQLRFAFPPVTYLDSVHRQGAGLLDIDDAITAETLLSPGKIALGEGNGGTARIQLRNSSGSPMTYDLSHEPAAGTTGTFTPPNSATNLLAYSTDYASASFSSPSVTVPGNGVANVFVTITPNPAMPDKGVYGGYVKFTPQGGGQEYRVPYAGFKGDYQSIQVLVPTATNFPRLARLSACNPPGILRGSECFGGGSYNFPPAADPYTFVAGLNETPMFLLHFDHQARSVAFDVYRVSDDNWMGTGLVDDYLPRNSTATSFFPFAWDGNVKKGQGNSNGNAGPVADGTYYVKLTLIKALGTDGQAETWTSPNFIIDRP